MTILFSNAYSNNYRGIVTFQVTIMFELRFVRFLATILNSVGLFLLFEVDLNFIFLDSDFVVGLMLYHCL